MIETAASRSPHEIRVLCHVHTRRSYDSWITPVEIVTYATQSLIDVVIVTDHDSHLGSLDCRMLSGQDAPLFPMAAEYRSTSGDMIAAFLKSPIVARDPEEIIDEAHAQGGIVILPHPFKHSKFSDTVLERADAIEVFNSRCSDDQNAQARTAAEALGKPMLVGPDAHLAGELGLAINVISRSPDGDIRTALQTGNRRFVVSKTTIRAIRTSQMLKSVRRMRPITFCKSLVRWAQANASDTP